MNPIRPIYSSLLYAACPLAMLYLLKRARKQPEYKQHWSERFGLASYPKPKSLRVRIMIHAVSVGETRATETLVEAILKKWPQVDIIYTHMTPTGREVGEKIARRYGDRITQSYLPYDTPFAVKRFLQQVRPSLIIMIETEVWPNLTFYAKKKGIPLILANARLSERSLKKGKKVRALIKPAMQRLDITLAQSEADAERLREAGCDPVVVLGNLKFDFTPNLPQLRTAIELRKLLQRPLVLFASTREGEEERFVKLIEKQEKDGSGPKPLWLIVPRHPQRFEQVRKLIEDHGLTVAKRSNLRDWRTVFGANGPQVILGDSMGEMNFYYALADVAVMGGSFGPYGSQSVIEPCGIGVPLIVGPSIFNFQTAIEEGKNEGALLQVKDEDDAMRAVEELLEDKAKREALSKQALLFSEKKRGATKKTMAVIDEILSVGEGDEE